MTKHRQHNPKLGTVGTLVVLGAAAYGGYQLYQAASKQPMDKTSCEAAGGTWHDVGPIGWCEVKQATT